MMTVDDLVTTTLDQAWETESYLNPRLNQHLPVDIVSFTETVLELDSQTYRQILLAIAAGTLAQPDSNPASLQLPAGVDRRSQAITASKPLADFLMRHGLTMKISQDPGVSNVWRTPEINESWLEKRRGAQAKPSKAMLGIVSWLRESNDQKEVKCKAKELLKFVVDSIINQALSNNLKYPKFEATADLAMDLVTKFLAECPDRPDALEAVVTASVRALTSELKRNITVTRGEINSPDPIDITIFDSDGHIRAGIEVTDNFLTLEKLRSEVSHAMLTLGLNKVSVFSRGVAVGEEKQIADYLENVLLSFQHQIELVSIGEIKSWLNFPGTSKEVSSKFLWKVGEELDLYSSKGNRLCWHTVLQDYISQV